MTAKTTFSTNPKGLSLRFVITVVSGLPFDSAQAFGSEAQARRDGEDIRLSGSTVLSEVEGNFAPTRAHFFGTTIFQYFTFTKYNPLAGAVKPAFFLSLDKRIF